MIFHNVDEMTDFLMYLGIQKFEREDVSVSGLLSLMRHTKQITQSEEFEACRKIQAIKDRFKK